VTRAEEFEQLRALLFAIAYRILGSVSEAEELGAGFLVMGKTGYGGLRRAMIGSISDYVVRHATAPVVVGE
jgi:hypothetical protein